MKLRLAQKDIESRAEKLIIKKIANPKQSCNLVATVFICNGKLFLTYSLSITVGCLLFQTFSCLVQFLFLENQINTKVSKNKSG